MSDRDYFKSLSEEKKFIPNKKETKGGLHQERPSVDTTNEDFDEHRK